MAKVNTRRGNSPNSRRGETGKQPKVELSIHTLWFNDVIAIILTAISIFFAVAIISNRLFLNNLTSDVIVTEIAKQNVMGPLGHLIAVMATGFFGWGAMLIPVWVMCLAIYYWLNSKNSGDRFYFKSKFSLFVGMLGSIFLFSALLHTYWGMQAGGEVGSLIAGVLLKSFNISGTSLILATFFLIFIAFATQFSSKDVITVLFSSFLKISKLIFIQFPKLALDLTIACWLFFKRRVFDYYLGKEKTEEAIQEPFISKPKPKLRKNKVISLDESEIVVRRRDDENNSKLNKELKEIIKNRKKNLETYEDYNLPDINLLTKASAIKTRQEDDRILLEKSRLIEEKLADFNIAGKITEVHPGPVITMFEFEPAAGVKVGKISSLQDDLSMSLRATAIRIIAPIPNKGTVGIEVPNEHRDIVRLREILESEQFINEESNLTVALGKNIYGDPVAVDIAKMPHLLMAGSTGSGKSVCINTILISMLYRCSPKELGLILIDPKMLELSVYEGIPHLKAPVVTIPKQARAVLEWAVKEMNRRYALMMKHNVRSIDAYNRMVAGISDEEFDQKIKCSGVVPLKEENVIEEGILDDQLNSEIEEDNLFVEELKPLEKIVIVVDEVADLMLSIGREIEDLVARLAQKARAAGIHLILATQRPSVDVITGLIKANFPARISFRVSSRIDSRTILDSMGSEKLLGMGDMLMMMPGAHHLTRVHGAFISDSEVTKVISSIKDKTKVQYDAEIMDYCEKAIEEDSGKEQGNNDLEYDELYDQTLELVIEKGQASTSMIQRAFRIGYNRAARIMDTLEKEGVIGPMDGSRPREILISKSEID